MKKQILTAVVFTAVLLGLAAAAENQQDKYSLKVPGGLAFSEFKGTGYVLDSGSPYR